MSLSKDQRKELLAALISAFPNKDKLAMMISFELNEKLDNITSADDHQIRVFYLIEWAESQGKFDNLIKGAYEFNPNNLKLKEFYNKYYNIPVPPTPSPVTPKEIYIPAKYEKLQKLLAAGEWKEADQETARVMLQVAGREKAGYLDRDSIEKFPCENLRTIDQLWLKYSDGKFGFSVQKNIWLECGGKVDYETECKLGDRIGWRVKGKWINYDAGRFTLDEPYGHLPDANGMLINFKENRWPATSFSMSSKNITDDTFSMDEFVRFSTSVSPTEATPAWFSSLASRAVSCKL